MSQYSTINFAIPPKPKHPPKPKYPPKPPAPLFFRYPEKVLLWLGLISLLIPYAGFVTAPAAIAYAREITHNERTEIYLDISYLSLAGYGLIGGLVLAVLGFNKILSSGLVILG